jgi:hypothetical protein
MRWSNYALFIVEIDYIWRLNKIIPIMKKILSTDDCLKIDRV